MSVGKSDVIGQKCFGRYFGRHILRMSRRGGGIWSKPFCFVSSLYRVERFKPVKEHYKALHRTYVLFLKKADTEISHHVIHLQFITSFDVDLQPRKSTTLL